MVRQKWVNQHAKQVNSKDMIMLFAVKVTLVGALRIWIVKPTNTNIANQTNSILNKPVYISFFLSIAFTTEEWASKYIWRYLKTVNLFWALNSYFLGLPFQNYLM